jgi:uncharacterized membrane protein YjjB (DUF3815 family)
MDLAAIATTAFFAGVYSCCLAFTMTAPTRFIPNAFICGMTGRFLRDALQASGFAPNWSTAAAAFVVVMVSMLFIRGHDVSPVVLISGVIPLGASTAMFHVLFGLMKLSAAKENLPALSVALTQNMSKVAITSLAIAVGLGAGLTLVQVLRRDSGLVHA